MIAKQQEQKTPFTIRQICPPHIPAGKIASLTIRIDNCLNAAPKNDLNLRSS